MLLFEFDSENSMVTKIVALTNQLQQELDDGEISDDFTVDDLLDFFQKYDVILDVSDLYSMIKVPPLKGLIKNIQGDHVVFKGQEENDFSDQPGEEPSGKTVAKMAKHALKK